MKGKNNACSSEISYYGKEGCKQYTIEVQKYLKALGPFIGAVLIVVGAALCFAGAKFIYFAFAALALLFCAGVLFSVFYSLLPLDYSSVPLLACGLAVSLILGAVFAKYVAYKFTKEWAVAVVGAWGGAVLGLFACRMAGVKNRLVDALIALVLAAIGFMVGKHFKRGIKIMGTAFVGAFLVIRGVSFYAGGYPGQLALPQDVDSPEAQAIWAYLGGLVGLTIAGAVVQFYTHKGDDADDEY